MSFSAHPLLSVTLLRKRLCNLNISKCIIKVPMLFPITGTLSPKRKYSVDQNYWSLSSLTCTNPDLFIRLQAKMLLKPEQRKQTHSHDSVPPRVQLAEHILYLLATVSWALLPASRSRRVASSSPASPSHPSLGRACRAGRLGPRGEGVERSSDVYFCA